MLSVACPLVRKCRVVASHYYHTSTSRHNVHYAPRLTPLYRKTSRKKLPSSKIAIKDLAHYRTQMAELLKSENYSEVVSSFEQMTQEGLEPDTNVYNNLLRALQKLKQDEKVENIFRNLKESGVADISVYNTMVSVVGLSDLKRAEAIFEEVKNDPEIKINIGTYNSLARVYYRHGEEQKFLDLFQEISSVGLLPNLATYNILFTKFQHTPEKLDPIYKLMVGQGIVTPEYLYKDLATLYSTSPTTSDLFLALAAEIHEKRVEIDEEIFGPFLNGFIQLGLLDEALTWTERFAIDVMKIDQQVLKDIETQNDPIRPLQYDSNTKNTLPPLRMPTPLDQKKSLIRKIQRERKIKKHQLVNRAYTGVLSAYMKQENPEIGVKTFEERFRALRVPPDLRTLTAFASCCEKSGKLYRVKEIYSEIEELGMKLDPFISSIMIKGFGRLRDFARVREIFRKTKESGGLSTFICNCVLDCYVKAARFKEAREFFQEEVLDAGVSISLATYTILSTIELKLGNPKMAAHYLELATRKNMKLDPRAWSVYLAALAQSEFSEKNLEKIFQVLRTQIRPNVHIYTALMKIYGEAGRHEDTLRILRNLQKKGPKPDLVTYTMLLSVFAKSNKMDSVWYFFQLLNEEGFTPDVCLWEVLLRAHLDAGDAVIVNTVLQQFRTRNIFPQFTAKFLGLLYNFYKFQGDKEMVRWIIRFGVPFKIMDTDTIRLIE